MMGQSATSGSLKIKNWVEWLIQQIILLPWYLDRPDKWSDQLESRGPDYPDGQTGHESAMHP